MPLELVLLHVLQTIHGAREDTGSGYKFAATNLWSLVSNLYIYQTLTLALSGRYILLLG